MDVQCQPDSEKKNHNADMNCKWRLGPRNMQQYQSLLRTTAGGLTRLLMLLFMLPWQPTDCLLELPLISCLVCLFIPSLQCFFRLFDYLFSFFIFILSLYSIYVSYVEGKTLFSISCKFCGQFLYFLILQSYDNMDSVLYTRSEQSTYLNIMKGVGDRSVEAFPLFSIINKIYKWAG